MKKLSYLLVFFLSIFLNTLVYANDIDSITMDIYVDNEGNAHIIEKWIATLDSGTEGYKSYYNLGQSDIKDFKVYLNNKEFTTLNYWDINASFSSKKYKAGLNPVNDGYELCFGISEYGKNTYTMNYTITNFVSTTSDADIIYWQLIPSNLSDKPEYVYIKIYSDFAYDDNIPVWGYGNYGGLAYVYDGYIELVHEDALDSDEYMTILAKFPKGTFNTSSVLDENFDYYHEMAENGAEVYKEKFNFLTFIVNCFSFCNYF